MWIAVVILAALAVAWAVSPHGSAGGPGGGPGGGHRGGGGGAGGGGGRRPPTVVGLAVAAPGDMPIQLSALGTVTSRASVVVRTRIAGVLTKVYYREGQMVRQGDPLVEVDPRPYEIALAQSAAQLLRDQALLAAAQVDLRRYQTLKAQDSIAGQTLDTQAALVKQDEGTVKADEASVANARLNLAYCHVSAPVSGRVGLRQVDAGNYVSTGDANGLVNITQIDPIDVVFTLPEDAVPQVSARIASGAALSVTAFDRTGGTSLSQGVLATLDNQIDTSTGTVKAKAAFSNPSGTLFPNQFVNVTLLVDTMRGVIIVPATAVRHGSKGDFVYAVQSDPLDGDTAKVEMVKVGPTVGERTAILAGVQSGERVITDGGDRLSDGATVLLPGQKPPSFGQQKKPGFFSWLGGLFGKKPGASPGAGGQAAVSGGDQSAGGGGGGGGGRGGRGGRTQAMIAQLGLDPVQQAKATEIFAQARQKAQAANGDPAARHAAMSAAMDQLNAILTPAQKAKLVELRAGGAAAGGVAPGAPTTTNTVAPAQAATPGPSAPPPGSNAAATAQVQATNAPPGGGGGGRMQAMIGQLGLDAGQQAKANAIFAEAGRKVGASGGDPDARRAIMHDAFTKLEAILRPDQKAKLDTLRAQRGQGGGG